MNIANFAKKIVAILLLSCVACISHAAIVASTATGTSFAASANVTSFTLNRPSSVNVGDLLFVQVTVSGNINITAPSGWTAQNDDFNNSVRQLIFYRVATSTDTANGTTTWAVASGTRVVASMTGYRSDLGGRAVVLGASTTTTGNSATMTAPAVTATAPGRLLRFYGQATTSTLTSSTLTTHVSVHADTSVTLLAGSRAIASSGATTTDVVTASSSGRFVIHSVLLTESTLNKPTTCYTDNFSSTTTFGQNWVTTTVGTNAFTPSIIGGRLRLTDTVGYEATGATLQRLFPTSNLIYVEFNHYAYNGTGADGIAVTLSDATITPQPGGFGGSLGYAQRSDSGGINGFAGGWMGIALDEYGNYSNPTEGRNGGPGSRVDAVAIRGSGSGQTGYPYVAGTATLSPGIDNSASTSAAPGYRYRIVIDAAAPGQTYVTVDRDTTGAGTSYTNIIPTFNIESSAGQATIPANLMLTLTGSSGGSTNIHEIGNLSVCASTINSTNQVDHFEFTYPTQALTCEAASVTVRACADAACSTQMAVPVTLTMNTSSGASFVGGSTVTFTGSTTLQLRQTTAGNGTFSVASSSPGAKPFSTNKCITGSSTTSSNTCTEPFVDTGLLFDVPNGLANRPSGSVRIRAVRTDNSTNACTSLIPANSTQNISFWFNYSNPNTASASTPHVVELRSVNPVGSFQNLGTTAGSTSAVPLYFQTDAFGDISANLETRYSDAGQMQLFARYTDASSGVVLNGSDFFVETPAGFCIDTTTSSTTCTGPNYANCSPFVAAGTPFRLQITAAAWEVDGDTNFCSGNGTTPNYNQSGIPLTPQLISPTGSGTSAGAIASYSNAFDLRVPPTGPGITMTNGSATFNDITESEVGVFTFTAAPPTNAYFGLTVNGGVSRNIGRFVPYRFDVAISAAIRNTWSCGFTYQDQPFGFDLDSSTNTNSAIVTVTALNAANQTTNNYDASDSSGNSFWKLSAGLSHTYSHLAPPTAGGTLQTGGTLVITPTASTINDANGKRDYQFAGETFTYTRVNTPNSTNAPFNANLQMTIASAALTDSDVYLDPANVNLGTTDQACYRSGCASGSTICTNACASYNSSAITNRSGQNPVEIRYGRLRLSSVSGPTDMNLLVPAVAEYWNGTMFTTNTNDNCTTILAGSTYTQLGNYTGNLSSGETSASSGGNPLVGGIANTNTNTISLSAPGANNYGSVDVTPTATGIPSWLFFDWDNNAATAFTAPTATASFGTYRGSDRVIYWQETQ